MDENIENQKETEIDLRVIFGIIKKNIIALICVLSVTVMLVVSTLITNSVLYGNNQKNSSASGVSPNNADSPLQENEGRAGGTSSISTPETKPDTTASADSTAPAASVNPTLPTLPTKPTQPTTTPASTEPSVPYATAIKPDAPADYQTQWDMGYLIAIDNPDTTYMCASVTLTEEDRDLLERLCMGEFGSGGFIGACLIAQSVKDAMCFDGYSSVAEVIRECRYTGSTDMGTNDECRQAVRYIFDENHDAVQHRLMYMYNPRMVQSNFHESQNFILSYGGVRFFDKWG